MTSNSPARSSKSELSQQFNEAQSRLVLQSSDLPLGTLADMVESRAIDLQPSFQRRERWKPEDQSSLIESFLLNVPVPPIYLSEEQDGTYTAIDGKQRLNAINRFMNGRLVLSSLDSFTSADGYTFSQLPTDIQNAFRLRPFLRVITLLKQTHSDLKYEVFLRLNRGGERLNDQEIRNVAYRGRLNELVFEMASNPFLTRQLKIRGKDSPAYRKMDDAEYVLRFFTLLKNWRRFSGRMAKEMDRFMSDNQRPNDNKLAELRKQFQRSILSSERIWGDHAFQRPDKEGWRDQLLAGMFDAQMLAVAEIDDQELDRAIRRRNRIVHATRSLFEESDFEEAVRTGTNTPSRIKLRVERMAELLRNT